MRRRLTEGPCIDAAWDDEELARTEFDVAVAHLDR